MIAFIQKEMLIHMHLVYFQSKSNRSRMVDNYDKNQFMYHDEKNRNGQKGLKVRHYYICRSLVK